MGQKGNVKSSSLVSGSVSQYLFSEVFKKHESVLSMVLKVVTTLTIDERRDKEGSIEQKVLSVTSASD
jgi:uncharacterized protein YqgV (UPF0045/DUF77 family)